MPERSSTAPEGRVRHGVSAPRHLVVVAGTHTEVGKTWMTAQLARELRHRGLGVQARKPLQSFDPASCQPTDADALAAATGEEPAEVCEALHRYPLAMAPPMAGEHLGRHVPDTSEIVAALHWSAPEVGLVETVGGVRSPLSSDGDSAELARALEPDTVVLVADAGLGVIDAVRGAVAGLAPLEPLVFLNHFDAGDDLHLRNRDWLQRRDSLQTFVAVDDVADRIYGAPRAAR